MDGFKRSTRGAFWIKEDASWVLSSEIVETSVNSISSVEKNVVLFIFLVKKSRIDPSRFDAVTVYNLKYWFYDYDRKNVPFICLIFILIWNHFSSTRIIYNRLMH